MAARLHRENDIAYDGVGKHSTALAVTMNGKISARCPYGQAIVLRGDGSDENLSTLIA
jgi:hypothetical protein